MDATGTMGKSRAKQRSNTMGKSRAKQRSNSPLRCSARTSWLLLAQELGADLLVPGADAATRLYNAPPRARQSMWSWWAGFWFSDRPYSGAEMRSAFACPARTPPRAARSLRAGPALGSVLDALVAHAQRSADGEEERRVEEGKLMTPDTVSADCKSSRARGARATGRGAGGGDQQRAGVASTGRAANIAKILNYAETPADKEQARREMRKSCANLCAQVRWPWCARVRLQRHVCVRALLRGLPCL